MEGHGSWRSTRSPCTPGVHYQRGSTLCICDEDGNWPNAACRDLFRVLHPVEVTGLSNLTDTYKCQPTKLYLVGCNVCFCPSEAVLDAALCTNKKCDEKDPALEVKDGPAPVTQVPALNNGDSLEIYASCISKYKYKLGCMDCECLTNNRLLCFNCTDNQLRVNSHTKNSETKKTVRPNGNKMKPKPESGSICDNKKTNALFFIRCNSCYCDSTKNVYCTSRKCITRRSVVKDHFKVKHTKLKLVKAPVYALNCLPGTKFKKDCNTCICVKNDLGKKLIDCTLKQCFTTNVLYEALKLECMEGTVYEVDCMLCLCYVEGGVKREICEVSTKCVDIAENGEKHLKGILTKSLNSLHGYCEPLHKYKNNCNQCRCLTDGKTLMCSSKICAKRSSTRISIDLVPVNMKTNEICPKGYSYKLDCNVCFCLSNGNAICTTTKCLNK